MKDRLSVELGRVLMAMRKSRGLSTRQMAEVMRVHHKTPGRIERGETNVRARDIMAWANACNANVSIVLHDNGAWTLAVTPRGDARA